jgi:hypothetical protein
VTLPAGTWDLEADIQVYAGGNGKFKSRLFDSSGSAVKTDVNGNDIVSSNVTVNGTMGTQQIKARLTLSSSTNLKFQTWTDSGVAQAGVALNGTGNSEPEVYLTARFTRVAM